MLPTFKTHNYNLAGRWVSFAAVLQETTWNQATLTPERVAARERAEKTEGFANWLVLILAVVFFASPLWMLF